MSETEAAARRNMYLLSNTLFHKSYTFWCNSKVLSNAPELLLCVQIPQCVHFAVSSARSLVMFNLLI